MYKVILYFNGDKRWFKNGKHHREDGPAVKRSDRYKAWYKNGELHRKDGHAVEYANGTKSWCLNGIKYTEEEFLKRTQRR